MMPLGDRMVLSQHKSNNKTTEPELTHAPTSSGRSSTGVIITPRQVGSRIAVGSKSHQKDETRSSRTLGGELGQRCVAMIACLRRCSLMKHEV